MSSIAGLRWKVFFIGCLAMPGVVFHELGHYLFCKLAGVRVHKVVCFRFGNPAGYVVHAAPRHFRDHFAIVAGPFVLNSTTALLLFASVIGEWNRPSALAAMPIDTLLLWLAAIWLAVSMALQAFPSKGDARSLWQVTNRHVRRGNILAVIGYPFVGIIYLANILRWLWLDWMYTGALLATAGIVFG